MEKGHILIVDDEESTVEALVALLRHDGFAVSRVSDGNQALARVSTELPDVVLLNIWLPGMDGIATLQALKSMDAAVQVIMMSGHGNVETAVKAMKLGAFDYLEKPFSPECLRLTLHQALHGSRLGQPQSSPPVPQSHMPPLTDATPQITPIHRQSLDHTSVAPGATCAPAPPRQQQKQKTLRRSMVLYGQGLQSGCKTGLILSPLPPHSGIIFRNIASGETLPVSIDVVESTDFSTSLHNGHVLARTIEHLMSTLHAYCISNLLITISDEIPIMDGSAAEFCRLIEAGGVAAQDAAVEEFVVDRCYHIGTMRPDAKSILMEPHDGLRITYRLDYPQPLGVQEVTYEHHNSAGYCREIAPARTFAFVKDVERMHDLGLIAGGRFNNVILVDDEKIINTSRLRFPDECARHKVLDLIGDLYLLGRPVRGHIRANMTGHTENAALVQMLRDTQLRGQ
jgi:UDP-3-O-[3-hydroxymyristoyl] N-acetylglucosamine deacetylase